MTEVALIFPGQGAQSVGMGREFYTASEEAKNIFDIGNTLVEGLTDVIFEGPKEKLTSTAYCQPAIFTYSIAALKAFEAHPKFADIQVRYTAGLSLGELSAVVAAGSLMFEDGLNLVKQRAAFMEEATQQAKGAMAAVIGFDQSRLEEICIATGAQIANYNSPDQIVITGHAQNVAQASEELKKAGAKRVIALDVGGAFHSTLMQPAVAKFQPVLDSVEFQASDSEILSNVDGMPTNAVEMIRSNLATQITSSVQWIKTIEFIANQGVMNFIEIGPGTVLKGLIRKINPECVVQNIQKPEDIDNLNWGQTLS